MRIGGSIVRKQSGGLKVGGSYKGILYVIEKRNKERSWRKRRRRSDTRPFKKKKPS